MSTVRLAFKEELADAIQKAIDILWIYMRDDPDGEWEGMYHKALGLKKDLRMKT